MAFRSRQSTKLSKTEEAPPPAPASETAAQTPAAPEPASAPAESAVNTPAPPADDTSPGTAAPADAAPGAAPAGAAPASSAPASNAPAGNAPAGNAPTESAPTRNAPAGNGGAPAASGAPAGGTAAKPAGQAAASGAKPKPNSVVDELEQKWLQTQAFFLDEPREAVRRSDLVVGDVLEHLNDVIANGRQAIRSRWNEDGLGTDELRAVMMNYRELIRHVIAAAELPIDTSPPKAKAAPAAPKGSDQTSDSAPQNGAAPQSGAAQQSPTQQPAAQQPAAPAASSAGPTNGTTAAPAQAPQSTN